MELMMSDPIDIVEIASKRLHTAAVRYRDTGAMQFCEASAIARTEALAELDAATIDRLAAVDFAAELMRAANVIGP
jgi:hypothetical protein